MLMRSLLVYAILLLVPQMALGQVKFQALKDLGFSANPYGINSSGVIVGSVVADESLQQQPAVWSNTLATPVILPSGGLGGFATAINDRGEVVGCKNFEFGSGSTPVLWVDGVAADLPTLGEGGAAQDINNAGVIVGYVQFEGSQLPSVWESGQLKLLPLPDFGEPADLLLGSANSITTNGEITGTLRIAFGSDSIALRWSGTTVGQLGLSTWLETRGIDSNDQGHSLVNGYLDPNGSFQLAIFKDSNNVQILPSPAMYSPVWGTALSPNNIAVGFYGDFQEGVYRLRSVAWVNGELQSLELPDGFLWSLPIDIGNDGTVIGYLSDGVTGNSIAGFWKLAADNRSPTTLSTAAANGAPGSAVNVTGTLTNRSNRRPIPNAVVKLTHEGRNLTARTNKDGRFSIRVTIPKTQPRRSRMQMEVQFDGNRQLQATKANTSIQIR